MTSLTKSHTQKVFPLQTIRLAEPFQHLNSFLVFTAPELGSHKATCEQAIFAQTAWINPALKVSIKCQSKVAIKSHRYKCTKNPFLLEY